MGFNTTPIGPLATYWKPPSTCLSTITSYNDFDGNLWLGMIGNNVDLNCYPPKFSTDYVYSPGLCPSGWTTACSPQADGEPTIFGPTISASQCCPSSFTCEITNNVQEFGFCTSKAPNSSISVLAVTGTAQDGSWVYSNFVGQVVQAKPVFIAYQSTDTEILASLTPTLKPTPSATRTPNPTSPTPPSPTISNPATLSQGAKIAIAVVIPVTVLALILATSLFCIRRRRKSQPPGPGEPYEKPELDGGSAGATRTELEGVNAGATRAELEGGNAGETRAELEGARLPLQEAP